MSSITLPLGYRPLPLLPASSVSLDTYDWSAVDECGPKCCATCSVIDFLWAIALSFTSAKTLSVSACASSMASSIPMSNCCGTGTRVADLDASTLGPIDGGGWCPLLDAVVCIPGA